MSHLFNEYKKSFGVDGDSEPSMSAHYYPVPAAKYITIMPSNGNAPSQEYRHYDLMLGLIKANLRMLGIKVVQIGYSPVKLLGADIHITDASPKNINYIISKSSCHVGVSSVYSHIASVYKVPQVTLFSAAPPHVVGEVWNKGLQYQIYAPYKCKPYYSAVDPEDAINKIFPEQVGRAILDSLNCEAEIAANTIYIGDAYGHNIVEIVPNFFANIEGLSSGAGYLRYDYGGDVNILARWVNYLPQSVIFTNKPLPEDFIPLFKNKIAKISYMASQDWEPSKEDIAAAESHGVPVNIFAQDDQLIKDLRIKFFDTSVTKFKLTDADKVPVSDGKLFFNSFKVILSDGKKYPSKFHFLKGENILDKDLPFEYDPVLLGESAHFYIYERKN